MTSSAPAGRRVSFGKYRAIAELGAGGMAEVYLAVAHGIGGFNKLHVIKRLRDELAAETEFLMMFLDEARLAARLNHPNIVQTYEVVVEDGQHFLVLEYVDGEPLRNLIRRAREHGEPLPLILHLQIIHDMLAGLHYAHEAKDFDGTPLQLVHRDVSPHNVLVSIDGHTKLLDFGVAKARTTRVNTVSGTIKGKVRYLAPEQVAGLHVDRRADLFAVGVMLWEAVTGEKFWSNLPEYRVLARLMSGDLPDLELHKPIPGSTELIGIIEKALAVDVEKRYATAAELRDDLAEYIHRQGRRPTEDAIGAFVTRVFATRRAHIHEAIERRIAALEEIDDISSPLLDLRTLQTGSSKRSTSSDPTMLVGPGPALASSSSSERLTATSDMPSLPAPGEASPPRRRWRGLLLTAIGGGIIVGLAAFLALRSPSRASAPVARGSEVS
ncbi:MAG: serine/threonine-protein kinase, partial [Myxococcota bacterium]